MKQFSKKTNQWILSTALVMALGSQYYYSVSSSQFGSVDMSSEASDKLAFELADKLKLLENTPKLSAADREALVKKRQDLVKEYTDKIAAEKANPEGQIVTEVCTTCGTGVMTLTGNQKDVAALKAAKISALAASATAATEVKVETAAERRERERDEREEARAEKQRIKDEKAEVKLQKLKDEKDKRNDDFTDKAEAIADRCGDELSCKTDRLAALLKSYSGKKKVDMFVVTKAFNLYIEKDLKAGLRGEDGSPGKIDALRAIQTLTGELPSEYTSIKTRTIDAVKYAEQAQAISVNNYFRLADQYTKANKLNEAIATRQQGFDAEKIFRTDATVYSRGIYEGLEASNDQKTLEYYKNNFVPELNRLASNLSNASGLPQDLQADLASGDLVTLPGQTLSTGRGGRTSNGNVINNNTITSGAVGNGTVNFGTQRAAPASSGGRTGINVRQ